MNTLSFLFFFACRPDYKLFDSERYNPEQDPDQNIIEVETEEETPEDPGNGPMEDNQDVINPDDIRPSMRLDAAIQHMGWGEMQTRCQIQIAFQRRHYPPREEDPNQNQGSAPERPDRPEEPGDCVFFRQELAQGNGNGNGGGQPGDNWFISGDLSGPELLYLHSDEQTIELQLTQAEDGMMRYEMPDCRQETFPFGEVFDLEIPESTGAGAVPAGYIEEVIAFGPDIIIETPETEHAQQQYQGYASDGLYFSWYFDGPVSDLLEERMAVRLLNNSNQPWNYHESLDCIPETREEHFLLPDDLLQFTLSQYLGENIFSIGLNVHGDYYGPGRVDPWGNAFRARVNVMRGGMMELTE